MAQIHLTQQQQLEQAIALEAVRQYAPADGSLTRGGSTSVCVQVTVRTSLVASQLQAASVLIA